MRARAAAVEPGAEAHADASVLRWTRCATGTRVTTTGSKAESARLAPGACAGPHRAQYDANAECPERQAGGHAPARSRTRPTHAWAPTRLPAAWPVPAPTSRRAPSTPRGAPDSRQIGAMSGRASRRDTAKAPAAAKQEVPTAAAAARAEPAPAARAQPAAVKPTPAAALAALAEAHKACAALLPEVEARAAASAAALASARQELHAVTKRLGSEPAEADLQRALRRRRALDAAATKHTSSRAEAHFLAYYTSRPAPPASLPPLKLADCGACRTEVADAVSVLCSKGGHHNCISCLSAHLASAAASQQDLNRGADVPCFFGCGAVLDAAAVVRALVANGDADAAANALRLAARAARLAGRIDTCAEHAAREAMTLPQRLNDLLQGLRCPACSLLYDFTTAGGSCMHASCSACGTAFCGFCFRASCTAERCPLNPEPGSTACENKDSAVVVCHALQVAQLLRSSGATAAERKAALDAAAPALAAASRPSAAVLDPSSPTLVREARGVSYATLLVNNALQAAYGGITGTDVPALVFSAVRRGDGVRLIDDVALLREGLAAEGIDDWSERAAALAADPTRVWRVKAVCDNSLELRPIGAADDGPSPTVPFFALAKHVPAAAVLSRLYAAAVDAGTINLTVGDAVYVGHELEALSLMCAQEAPDGTPRVGWNRKMAVLARGWALMQKPYPLAREGRPRGLAQVVAFGAGAADVAPGHSWYLPPQALTRAVPVRLLEQAFAACCE